MNELQFGPYRIDPLQRQLCRGEEVLALPAKAFDLLLYMASNPGRPLLKNELMRAVWPDATVDDSNLSQNVFLLRKALGTGGAGAGGPIVTLPGRGYQFAQQVTEVPVAVRVEAVPPVAELLPPPPPARSHPSLIFLAIALALTAAGAAGWAAWQRWQDHVGGPPVQVVLADWDGGTGDPILDRTLLDTLRADLAQSPFVTVVGGSTVRRTLAEMGHPADQPLTAALARDLCERTGSQAVLHGTVTPQGARYLVAQEATSCVDGTTLIAVRREAGSRDLLPGTLHKLAEPLRHGLGEAHRTIARFSVPLLATNTGSLDALEDWSQANAMSQRGKILDATALLRRAVAADPNFAAAWLDLANMTATVGDTAGEREAIQKAYDLRSTAPQQTQFYIAAHYDFAITGDRFQSLRTYAQWSELYPRNFVPLIGFSESARLLGMYAEAIPYAQRGVQLNPHAISAYYSLASNQLHGNDPAAATATCRQAFSRGLDGEALHSVLQEVAFLTHDSNLLAEQRQWAATHAESAHISRSDVTIALAEGRLEDARNLQEQATKKFVDQRQQPLAQHYARELARSYAELGQLDEARALIAQGSLEPEDSDQLAALIETGSPARAQAMLAEQLKRHPQSTQWTRADGPEIAALIALAAKQPEQAIRALEPTRGLESLALDFNSLRGQAYLLSNHPAQAEEEFRLVLAHQSVDPMSYLVPLTWVHLARAQAAQGHRAEAAASYDRFFALWSKANGNPLLLTQARAERSAL